VYSVSSEGHPKPDVKRLRGMCGGVCGEAGSSNNGEKLKDSQSQDIHYTVFLKGRGKDLSNIHHPPLCVCVWGGGGGHKPNGNP
jgi:hypothetical protein